MSPTHAQPTRRRTRAPRARRLALLSLCLLLAAGGAPARARRQSPRARTQTQQPARRPAPQDEDLITVNTNLVQVDAVVTDEAGRQVTDLRAEDFEIVEGGRTHAPDYCSYVAASRAVERAGEADEAGEPRQLRAGELRRTFVFLVSNPLIDVGYSNAGRGGVSSGSFSLRPRAVRAAVEAERVLARFVEEQMGPNDLAAVADAEVDLGVLSSFTNDRAVLRAAIRRVRDNAAEGGGRVVRITSVNDEAGLQPLVRQNLRVIEMAADAVEKLRQLPGRKMLVLLSRGMMFDPRLPGSDAVRERMSDLIARANRARVTIHALSPSGVGNFGGVQMAGTARAGVGRVNLAGLAQGLQDVDSLVHLARETGGRAVYNTNDARVGFSEVLEESRGYYLLAYNPGAEALSRPHRIQVRVRRAGLRVRARATAYAPAAVAPPASEAAATEAAINSPLAVTELGVVLTAAVSGQTATPPRVAARLRVELPEDAGETGARGGRPLALELRVRVVGPDGRALVERANTLTFDERAAAEARREGFETSFEFEAERAGFHRIDAAVADKASGRAGSATRFVEVPARRK